MRVAAGAVPLLLLVLIAAAALAQPEHDRSDWQEEPGSDTRLQEKAPEGYTPRLNKPVFHRPIQHSDRLPAIASELSSGQLLKETTLPRCEPNNEWYWIPSWLAGTWLSQEKTSFYSYDFRKRVKRTRQTRTGCEVREAFGCQRDKLGGVWHYVGVPFTLPTAEGAEKIIALNRRAEPALVSEAEVVTRSLGTSIYVDKRTDRIVGLDETEDIETATPAGQGMMKVHNSVKLFDKYGQPVERTRSVRISRKIADFLPVDHYDGQDMKELFREFLTARALYRLIPGDEHPGKDSGQGK